MKSAHLDSRPFSSRRPILDFRRAVRILCAAALLAPVVSATWSIVAVNTRTGEVCIASATCLEDLDLQALTPVVRVGLGGACAQSVGDTSGENRMRIWSDLIAGLTPEEILADLAQNDPQHQRRQYGIVNMNDDPVSFSGNQDGIAFYGVGRVNDDLRYAIQGNVLAGIQVITNAEEAFLSTDGDLSQKVMAAMEAARVFGGDGRCSCTENAPTSCGCPPPHFTYSAYTGFFVLARIGDVDGICDGVSGCATGSYFADLRSISAFGGPEPVLDLENQYVAWRAGLAGRTDQLRTRVLQAAQRLPADGLSELLVTVELRDIDGNLVTGGSPILSVAPDYGGPPVATVGAVQPVSPGIFEFPLTSTLQSGPGRWKITVQEGSTTVLLWPELEVDVDPLTALHCGWSVVSATAPARVPLTVNLGPAAAGRQYLILASASGTVPGFAFQGVHLPLNPDLVLRTSYRSAGYGRFPGTLGNLDANGHAVGAFQTRAGLLAPWLGRRFDWSAVVFGSPNEATNNDGFVIVP